MERRLERQKMRRTAERIKAAVRGNRRVETTAGGGGGGSQGGAQSIQDPDGVLYDMCGVSICGGPDITGP